MLQYRRIKQEHSDSILFFRLGDFYEMFERDAKEASSLLNLTLTARNGVPMCGIPYHAAHTYVARLLRAGKKIAICEQLSLAVGGKGLADREVVEVITPGTVVDPDYLEERSNNYLVSLARAGEHLSLSYIDLSTGEFATTDFPWEGRGERIKKELARLAPRELIIQESLLEEDLTTASLVAERPDTVVNRYPDWNFDLKISTNALTRQFGTASLKGFGIGERSPCIYSAGILLEYAAETSKSLTPHIKNIRYYSDAEFLGLDESTQRNLEIYANLQDGTSRYTLFEVLDHTKSSMGTRRLKRWLAQPLSDAEAIRRRLDRVEFLYRNQAVLSGVRDALGEILDLERLTARIAMDRAHAKDLLGIKASLSGTLRLLDLLSERPELFWSDAGSPPASTKSEIVELRDLLGRAIDDDPSVLLTEGGLIKEGYNEELDELQKLKRGSQSVLDAYLEEERAASGIGSLKLRYNRIIGYFFEITKANLGSVPPHFIRRQSLVGGERFTTDRLVELETRLNSATERIVELERQLFLDVRASVKGRLGLLLTLADRIADTDVLQSFAQAATVRGYTKPQILESGRLTLTEGRHPVVEANLPVGEFVPNGCVLDSDGISFALITGPNMAGKSTYLRQVALIVLMAQAGSFVPAREAAIGVVDRIFCRVGVSDNLARGESTFLVEMNETAHILHSATSRSLVIMDEVGRGTGTNDGLSIAWAVLEDLLERLSVKTLFATHYHELTAIVHPKLHNLSMAVLERKGEIVFLKKVADGPSANSYGIHVARLAGLPEGVIARASNILSGLTGERPAEDAPGSPARSQEAAPRSPRDKGGDPAQAELFPVEEAILGELAELLLDATTPIEALNLIAHWKRLLDRPAPHGQANREAGSHLPR